MTFVVMLATVVNHFSRVAATVDLSLFAIVVLAWAIC
jgi:hypothetical protein